MTPCFFPLDPDPVTWLRSASSRLRTSRPRRLRTWSIEPLEDRALLNAGDLDASFGIGGKVTTDFVPGLPSGDIAHSVAVQPNGKIVAAGFSGSDFGLARYNSDGSLDTAFGSGGKVTTSFGTSLDSAFSVALQADGKILAAGTADNVFALARYNADGSLDTGFGSGGKVTTAFEVAGAAHSVALQADGKIVAAGPTLRAIGSDDADFALARYNADGSLDTGFGSGGKVITAFGSSNDTANSVVVQADGKIVVAGSSDQGGDNGLNSDFALARYNADGSLDASFGSRGRVTTDFGSSGDIVYSVALQADGKIVAAGDSNLTFGLARYKADGSLDTSFGSDGKVTTNFGPGIQAVALGMALQADGRIVAAGTSYSNGDDYDFVLARYKADGSQDTSFGSGGKVTTNFGSPVDIAFSVALQADGKIVAAGSSQPAGTQNNNFTLARYLGAGVDTTAPTTTATPDGPRGQNGWNVGPVTVILSASDPDDSPSALTTAFSLDGTIRTYTGPFTIATEGVHQLIYWSSDPAGNVESPKTRFIKVDLANPTITMVASPTTLWPPNGQWARVTVQGRITDRVSGIDPASLAFAVFDEYGRDQPTGRITQHADGTYSFPIGLKARRAGSDSDGRQYIIIVTATDLAGHTETVSAGVVVPHDRRGSSQGGASAKAVPMPSGFGSGSRLAAIAGETGLPPSSSLSQPAGPLSLLLGTAASRKRPRMRRS